ncbi:MAG: reverse transcriptase/maturase family protein [Candidatus Paceibacterota bacterium]
MRTPLLKENILKAVKKTRNTSQKKSCFLELPTIAEELSSALQSNGYNPLPLSCFVVKDPKIREIFAPDYKDRVIHHLVVDRVEKFIDKKFISDCYSNRKNKGTHGAIKKLRKFLGGENRYCLKGDIKSFFPSIDKNILWKIFSSHVQAIEEMETDEKISVLNVSKKIIFQNPISPLPRFTGDKKLLLSVPREKSLFYTPKNKGLPIGSLTSQFFANVYLNELDRFIKHGLRIKQYIRYVDDFVILGKDRETLSKRQKEIQKFLEDKLKLSLHHKKTFIRETSKGIDFLGYIVRKKYILVRKRTIRSFKRKLYFFNHLIRPDIFPVSDPPPNLKISKRYLKKDLIVPVKPDLAFLQKILSIINSYYGMFSFANSYNLRRTLYERRFLHLKKYFIPGNNYKKIKINPAFLEDGNPKI